MSITSASFSMLGWRFYDSDYLYSKWKRESFNYIWFSDTFSWINSLFWRLFREDEKSINYSNCFLLIIKLILLLLKIHLIFFETEPPNMQPWLTWYLSCRSVWPWTDLDLPARLLNAVAQSKHYYTWHL